MMTSYLTVAIRRLARNRMTTLINIGGLSIGFAAVVTIGLYVAYEFSYNRWLANIDRLYKVEFSETEPGHAPISSAMTPAPLAAALAKDYAGIEVTTRLKTKSFTVRQGSRQFTEEIYFTDPGFFDVFDLETIEGNRSAVLADESSVAISESMALKYFGGNSPVGEVLTFGAGFDKTVVAVLADTPANSHLKVGFLTRVSADASGLLTFRQSWGSDQVHTYFKTRPGYDPSIIETEARAFAERNISLTWTNLPPADVHKYNVLPVADIHLYSDQTNHESKVGDITIVLTFAAVAMLVLVLAVINFANLSTAHALKCVREVSMRKVLGASRGQVARQFLGEAIMMTLFALIVGLTIVEVSLPVFGSFLGKELSLAPLASPATMAGLLGLALVAGVSGGFYPAVVLSALRPSRVLRSNRSGFDGAPILRSTFVVLQFAVSIALIAATSIIYRQTDYVRNADLGFDPSGKLLLPVWEQTVRPSAAALREGLRRVPGVKGVASTTAPLPGAPHGLGVFIPDGSSRDESKSITMITVDASFFPLLDLAPLSGRLFEEGRSTDFALGEENFTATRGVVINRSAANLLGYRNASAVIGQDLTMPTSRGDAALRVIGVVPDTHFGSLHTSVQPAVFFASHSPLFYLVVDLEQGARAATMQEIESLWQELVPGAPLSAIDLGDAYATLYRDAERQAVVFTAFSVFAVFVACLGLYGLSAFTAQNRTKEIGVRKVVGASETDIIMLLTWQFSKLVLIAVPFGVAASMIGMHEWLNGFAYRISLFGNAWVFLIAAMLAFAIAWVTIGSQAARVARLSPIKALRYE